MVFFAFLLGPSFHLFAVILNSIMLALDDSEIPINSKFAALSLLLSDKDEILPDPCKSEELGNVISIFSFVIYRISVMLPMHSMKREKYYLFEHSEEWRMRLSKKWRRWERSYQRESFI